MTTQITQNAHRIHRIHTHTTRTHIHTHTIYIYTHTHTHTHAPIITRAHEQHGDELAQVLVLNHMCVDIYYIYYTIYIVYVLYYIHSILL